MFLLVRMSVEVLSRVRKKNNYKVWCETNYAHYLNMDSVKNEQSAKKIYETSNGAKSLLMAMCIGLRSSSKENQRSLGDLTLEPFSSSRQTRQFIPKKAELVKEVERRCIITLNESPRAANWSNTALTEWLMTHPVECEEEVKYLQTEEAKFHDILFEANKEAVVIARNSSGHTNGMVWNNFADMRLIHCLIVESVREAYLQRNEVLNRRQLDARNGPAATLLVEEIIANQYNDSNFGPRSIMLPSLHEDFIVSHDLSLERMPCEVSPDQVKRWLADRKAKLVLMINKWERSGNGGGNRKEDNEMFGQCEGTLFQDDDDRSNFLCGNRTSLLYFWHMAIHHDILSHTVNILPKHLSATTESVSPVSRKMRKDKKRKFHEENKFPDDIVEGFRSISRVSRSEEITNCEMRIQRDENRVEEYIKKLEHCFDDNLKQFYRERLNSAKMMLNKATEDYQNLHE